MQTIVEHILSETKIKLHRKELQGFLPQNQFLPIYYLQISNEKVQHTNEKIQLQNKVNLDFRYMALQQSINFSNAMQELTFNLTQKNVLFRSYQFHTGCKTLRQTVSRKKQNYGRSCVCQFTALSNYSKFVGNVVVTRNELGSGFECKFCNTMQKHV